MDEIKFDCFSPVDLSFANLILLGQPKEPRRAREMLPLLEDQEKCQGLSFAKGL